MNFKKILTSALVLAAASSFIFAISDTNARPVNDIPGPASMTANATAATFSTDVDEYISITGWNGVNFGKGFAFIDYGFQGNRFNAGYATKLAGNYLGLWFGGNGADFDMISQSYSDSNKGNNTFSFNGNGTSYAASALFGLGKNGIGIKASMFYLPTTVTVTNVKDVKVSSTESVDLKNEIDIYNLNLDLTVGLGGLVKIESKGKAEEGKEAAAGKTILSNLRVSLGLDNYEAKNVTRIGYADSSFRDLYLRAGADVLSWEMQLDTRWRLFPSTISDVTVKSGKESVNTKTLVTGASDNLIAITASRTFGLDVMEGKLALRAKPVLPLHFGFLSNQYGTKSGNSDWVYSNNKNEIDIVLVPELNLGAQYQLLPKKVDFNCGANFALGTLGWNILTTNHRDDRTTKNASYKDTVTDFGWDSTNMNIGWQSGFTVHFGENVTLDLAYNLLGTLLNNMSTNNGAGWVSTTSPFWGSIENLFVTKTNLSMQLSVKF